MKPLAILALLAFAGCSAHNNLVPMPNITQGPVEAQTASCNVSHDTIKWTRLKKDYKHFRIYAPSGYRADSAEVWNDMSNGVYVRGGNNGNKRTYVPGHDETQGGKPKYVKMGKNSSTVVLRTIADPTNGKVVLDIRFCSK